MQACEVDVITLCRCKLQRRHPYLLGLGLGLGPEEGRKEQGQRSAVRVRVRRRVRRELQRRHHPWPLAHHPCPLAITPGPSPITPGPEDPEASPSSRGDNQGTCLPSQPERYPCPRELEEHGHRARGEDPEPDVVAFLLG